MYPSPLKEAYGIFVHEQAKALIEKGCDVRVVSPVPWSAFPLNKLSSKWNSYSNIPSERRLEGVQVYYPRYLAFPKSTLFESSGIRMYHGIKKTINKIHKKFQFDIIHAHVALPDGDAAIMLATKYQTPVITTVHGADLYLTVEKNTKCKQKVASVFSQSDKIVFVSKRLEQIAKEKTISNVESIVISNGVSFEKQGTLRHRTTITENKPPTIFSASYLITRKAIHYNLMALAEVLKKHNNVNYKIAGDGPEQDNLRKLVNDLGINKQVQFLGMLSHREAIEEMFEADIFSLPSWDEAFGVVYIEAMAEGKPVIACRGEGIEDVITHGETGLLVKPKSVDSLVEAFDFLLCNPGKAKSIGERARKLVLDNYTWENNAKKYQSVYKEILTKQRNFAKPNSGSNK
jgi:hypothetical protein